MVCEYISLLEVKVMILVFYCLAQFMKCDELDKTLTKIVMAIRNERWPALFSKIFA
jgi:hypothetical protein